MSSMDARPPNARGSFGTSRHKCLRNATIGLEAVAPNHHRRSPPSRHHRLLLLAAGLCGSVSQRQHSAASTSRRKPHPPRPRAAPSSTIFAVGLSSPPS